MRQGLQCLLPLCRFKAPSMDVAKWLCGLGLEQAEADQRGSVPSVMPSMTALLFDPQGSCSVIPRPYARCRCEKPPTVIDWMRPRKLGSQLTRRWREKDSNPRSPGYGGARCSWRPATRPGAPHREVRNTIVRVDQLGRAKLAQTPEGNPRRNSLRGLSC
jgi:hypothetical protein